MTNPPPPSPFWLAVPNSITMLRLILAPVSAILIIQQSLGQALLVFIIVALSDKLDGEIARRLNARTNFGAYLDPIADKFFIIATYAALSFSAMIPLWLGILVIGRDIVMMTAGAMTWLAYRKIWIYDTVAISRIATTAQMSLAALVLAANYFDLSYYLDDEATRQWGQLLDALFWLIVALTFIAGLVYAWRWLMFLSGRAEPYPTESSIGGRGEEKPQ